MQNVKIHSGTNQPVGSGVYNLNGLMMSQDWWGVGGTASEVGSSFPVLVGVAKKKSFNSTLCGMLKSVREPAN